jgi:hypothetical protein
MKLGVKALGAGLAACLCASAASGQIVVLSARGPSAGAYPQGSVLAPNRAIALKAGDQLTVLDGAGSHLLSGPATITASQIDVGARAGLQEIFRKANASRPGIAAVRGFSLDEGKAAAPAAEAPPLFRLDVSAWQQAEPMDGHNFCVVRGQRPVLTRASDHNEGSLAIVRDGEQSTHTVLWPAGSRDLAWPADLEVADGATYALNLDAAGATRVRWRLVDGSGGLTQLASALLDDQCYDQLDALQSQVAAK